MSKILALPFAALIMPLLTSAAAWALALWALRQKDYHSGAARALSLREDELNKQVSLPSLPRDED